MLADIFAAATDTGLAFLVFFGTITPASMEPARVATFPGKLGLVSVIG